MTIEFKAQSILLSPILVHHFTVEELHLEIRIVNLLYDWVSFHFVLVVHHLVVSDQI
jgi:hypothetical protein